MVKDFGQGGLVFNSWNGYTEGMAAVPTREYGNTYYSWLRRLLAPELHIVADKLSALVNEPIRFTPTITLTAGAAVTEHEWHLGSDSVVMPGRPEAISRSFASVGSHKIWLAATDSNGQTGVSNVLTVQVMAVPTADFDRDGDVDQADFGRFQACYTAQGQPVVAGCEDADLDADRNVDMNDFRVFQACMSGAHVTADPPCAG
jgi:hypothetical protein